MSQYPDPGAQTSGYPSQGYGSGGYAPDPQQTQPYAGYGQPVQPYPAQTYPAQNPYAGSYGNPYAGGYGNATEHPSATAVLVLGILGFVTGITGLIAWIMGHKAMKEVKAGEAEGRVYVNKGQLQAGWICGIISTILVGGGILLYVGIIVVYLVIFGAVLAGSTY